MMMKVDNFEVHDGAPIDPSKIRARCVCGSEYPLSQSKTCPACGRRVPKSLSFNGGGWKSYAEWKAESLRSMLSSERQESIPPEHRDALRRNIEKQICQLEDGTWKREVRRRIEHLKDMLEKGNEPLYIDALKSLSDEQRLEVNKAWELAIQTARQELEAAGETP